MLKTQSKPKGRPLTGNEKKQSFHVMCEPARAKKLVDKYGSLTKALDTVPAK